MNNIDKTGLNNFCNKLKNYNNKTKNLQKQTIDSIVDTAESIIKSAYAGTNVSVITERNDNTAIIYAKDKAIAFDEFGTGFYAKGTYEGELPKETLTFSSARKQHSTSGWEYYYPNFDTKRIRDGKIGWFIPPRPNFPHGTFHTGKIASNRFYRSCKKIKERYKLSD